jgi:hypothetical protein
MGDEALEQHAARAWRPAAPQEELVIANLLLDCDMQLLLL